MEVFTTWMLVCETFDYPHLRNWGSFLCNAGPDECRRTNICVVFPDGNISKLFTDTSFFDFPSADNFANQYTENVICC